VTLRYIDEGIDFAQEVKKRKRNGKEKSEKLY